MSLLVIFDCDGVLVDSEPLGNAVFTECLTEFGIKLSVEESTRRFRGMKLATCLEILEGETSIRLPDTFESDLRARMSEAFGVHLQPVDGALRLVESLRVPFCVASSGPRNKIEENLRTTGLYPHFDGKVYSSYDIASWKPDPGLFLHAAKDFDVVPEDCIVIEDSAVGVRAGKRANMQVLALDTLGGGEAPVEADYVFRCLNEIRAHLVSQGLASGHSS